MVRAPYLEKSMTPPNIPSDTGRRPGTDAATSSRYIFLPDSIFSGNRTSLQLTNRATLRSHS